MIFLCFESVAECVVAAAMLGSRVSYFNSLEQAAICGVSPAKSNLDISDKS